MCGIKSSESNTFALGTEAAVPILQTGYLHELGVPWRERKAINETELRWAFTLHQPRPLIQIFGIEDGLLDIKSDLIGPSQLQTIKMLTVIGSQEQIILMER